MGKKYRHGNNSLIEAIFLINKLQAQRIMVTSRSKFLAMKKILVASVLLAGVTVVAFASIDNNKKKVATEKKCEMNKECNMTKECSHSCPFSK